MEAPSCILLLGDQPYLADAAEAYARRLFDVRCAARAPRAQKVLGRDVIDALAAGPVDFILNFLSPVILPEPVLATARVAAVNFHPAPPKWPGVGSVSFALYEGDTHFGVTAHLMTARVDSGPILRTLRFPITPADDCQALWDRALHYALVLFYEIALELSQTRRAIPSGVQWERPAITRREFDKWMTLPADAPPDEVRRKVRALRHPRFPGPFVEIGGVRFAVPPATAA